MFASGASYLGGTLAGFVLGLLATLAFLPLQNADLISGSSTWLAINMGHSVWFFGLVLVSYWVNLTRLKGNMGEEIELKQVVQLDQLSDVWIHLFVGIGVVWTAIGMRSALATTLNAPDALTDGAGEILSRLVDGGILLALTTTIVGAIGGYLMRLVKTVFLGTDLTDFYQREERRDLLTAVAHLSRIESHLESLLPPGNANPDAGGQASGSAP